MPIPFLLGAAAVLGLAGAAAHVSASSTNEKAEATAADARRIYYEEKKLLDTAKRQAQSSLTALGEAKKDILLGAMQDFMSVYTKLKNAGLKETAGIDELKNFSLNEADFPQIQKLTALYQSAESAAATGAAVGAVGTIAGLAASGEAAATLATAGTAGTAILAGEIGTAGAAASALAAPLAAIAAPAVLFTGISAMMNADENLDKANEAYAQARLAVEQMKNQKILCNAICQRSELFIDLMASLSIMFVPCVGMMMEVVRRKESKGFLGFIFKRRLKSSDFTENEMRLFAVTRAIAGAIKSVIDTPMLSSSSGKIEIANESDNVYPKARIAMTQLKIQVDTLKSIDFVNDTNLLAAGEKAIQTAKKKKPKEKEQRKSVSDPLRCSLVSRLVMIAAFYFALPMVSDSLIVIIVAFFLTAGIRKEDNSVPYSIFEKIAMVIIYLLLIFQTITYFSADHTIMAVLWGIYALISVPMVIESKGFSMSLEVLLLLMFLLEGGAAFFG